MLLLFHNIIFPVISYVKIFYFLFIFLLTNGIITAQVIPYSETPIINRENSSIINFKHGTPSKIKKLTKIVQHERDQYIFNLKTNTDIKDVSIYIFDENNAHTGPYYFNNKIITTNPFTCNDCYIFINTPNILLQPKVELLSIKNSIPNKTISPIPFIQNNRENPIILVTGYWPPTNEMIRHFSQNESINPQGWQGDNWEDLGYDVISFFPQFEDPNCNNCGIGFGDFTVDYQNTSNDYWPIVNELQPIAIITFSRGYIDYSWEMEFNFFNRLNWYSDYLTPLLPTPNPPDGDVSNYFIRNSSLPVENLVNAINNSGLNIDAYIDWNGNPGQFVSEYMGYHGVWYKELNSFGDNNCVTAGHIHVGGLIEWDIAKQAAEISIREIINYVDEFSYISGDINNDDIINILDIVILVNVILGTTELTTVQTYAADINGDNSINIQDIILTINLILL